MMGALLALIPSRDFFYGGIIIALIAFGVYERAHLIDEGKAHEIAALAASSAKLQAQTAAQTAELKAKADMAQRAYDKEILSLSSQPAPVVRVCHNANSGPVVSQGSGAQPGAAASGTSSGGIQQVPAGDSSSAGPDIGGLLSALAASADEVSAALREAQSR